MKLNQNATMNKPRPTLSNFQRGEIAIVYNSDLDNLSELNLLMELAFPNDPLTKFKSLNKRTYFFAVNNTRWGHSLGTKLETYTLKRLLASEYKTLKKVWLLAEDDLLKKRVIVDRAKDVYEKAKADFYIVSRPQTENFKDDVLKAVNSILDSKSELDFHSKLEAIQKEIEEKHLNQ